MSGTYKVNGDKLTGLTVYSTLPVGTVIATVSTSEVGFLAFDGSEYDGADYPTLYDKVKNLTAFQSETTGYFKLPNLAGRTIQQAESELGVLVEAGLPNITGVAKFENQHNMSGSGAFDEFANSGGQVDAGPSAVSAGWGQRFNASHGETKTDGTLKTDSDYKVFGKSDTVQPPAITLNFLIKATDYASLPQNAIDDTRVTNANTYSAEKIESKFEYSTEEKVIGEYFGKPLYRKGYIFSTLSTSQTFNTDFTGSVETIANWGGGCGSTTGIKVALNRLNAELKYEADKFVYTISSDLTLINAKLWVEYTKTTD